MLLVLLWAKLNIEQQVRQTGVSSLVSLTFNVIANWVYLSELTYKLMSEKVSINLTTVNSLLFNMILFLTLKTLKLHSN